MPEARSSESSRAPEGEWVRLTGETSVRKLEAPISRLAASGPEGPPSDGRGHVPLRAP